MLFLFVALCMLFVASHPGVALYHDLLDLETSRHPVTYIKSGAMLY